VLAIRRQLRLWRERPRCRGFGTWVLALGGVLAGVLVAAPALASRIETILEPFTGSSSSVLVALEDDPSSGQILLSVEVIEGVADIRGVFFDMANDSLLADLEVTGDWVTSFDASGGIIKEGGGNNLNGGGSPCPCDVGVQIGTSGIGRDEIRSTSFVLSHPDMPLSLSLFLEQPIGVRLTSVGVDEYHRGGSSKLGGLLPVPEPHTGLLLAAGLIGLAFSGSRRRMRGERHTHTPGPRSWRRHSGSPRLLHDELAYVARH